MTPHSDFSARVSCRACVPGELPNPERLRLLHQTGLLEGRHPRLDRLTRLASKVLSVPVVLVSLVDIDRQVFASQNGLGEPWASAGQTPLSHSFCQYVVTDGEPLIVSDSRKDARLTDNLAIPDLKVIAYAGYPIISGKQVLGSFCAIKSEPHEWLPLELELLEEFAESVSDQIELRLDYEDLKLTTENLAVANQELENLADILAHDLNSPLRGIRGTLYLLDDVLEDKLPEDAKELMAEVGNSAARMSKLIDALSDFSNTIQASVTADWVDLNSVLKDVEQDLGAQLVQSGARIEVADLGTTFGITPLLRQLFQNLIANAIKFQPSGQQPLIQVGRDPNTGAYYVKDNGLGIKQNSQERIFGIYKRGHTKGQYSGLGLGLAICSRVVSKHNGRIWVESKTDQGSTFFFTLALRAQLLEAKEEPGGLHA